MLRPLFALLWLIVQASWIAPFASGEEKIDPETEKLLAAMHPVALDVSDRELPSNTEWDSLHEDEARGLFDGLADFHSRTVAFMNTRYYTPNQAEGTLASFGKMGSDKRYDRYGHIRDVEFSIENNSWKQRHVLNAAALFKLAGSRFMEFAGVGVDVAARDKRQIEVTFIGTNVPKEEAIRRLNDDIDALEYLEGVREKRAEHDRHSFKLFAGKAPPEPKVVLSNVVMLDGKFAKAMEASIDGKLHSRILDDGVELKFTKQSGEETTLLSPVVRCYRTYAIEFKKDPVKLRDARGRIHEVPQVFDLTPDL
jgi:hypothetical protein